MSVRRLADPAVQPPAFAFSGAMQPQVDTWIAKYPADRKQSAVIPLLMLAQEQEGWVTKSAIEHVADMLDMPYIRVLEVATFYTQFQLKPVGTKAHVQVCGTTPCMIRGADALIEVCKSKIHHDQFHANESGTLSWEEVECLGACANAPMVMVFKDTYEDLTPETLAALIDGFEAGNPPKPGPQTDRYYSAPAGGFTSLTDEDAIKKNARAWRDRPAEPAPAPAGAAAAPAPAAAPVAPSQAAKPKTDAPETNPAIKSPSPEKANQAAESADSVKAPAHNGAEANKADPSVEGEAKQRSSRKATASSDDAYKAPEAGKEAGSAEKPSLESADRPAGIEKPATPDDLKMISGVGPKIEGTLQSLGIYTFAQIAAWNEAQRGWVDGYLNFRGRIDRDDWVKQADALAKGGEAEYVRVFGKKPR